jgi:hypothetical protein
MRGRKVSCGDRSVDWHNLTLSGDSQLLCASSRMVEPRLIRGRFQF